MNKKISVRIEINHNVVAELFWFKSYFSTVHCLSLHSPEKDNHVGDMLVSAKGGRGGGQEGQEGARGGGQRYTCFDHNANQRSLFCQITQGITQIVLLNEIIFYKKSPLLKCLLFLNQHYEEEEEDAERGGKETSGCHEFRFSIVRNVISVS